MKKFLYFLLGLVACTAVFFIARGVYNVVPSIEPQKGSAVGPESSNSYQCYNGVCTYYAKAVMSPATTTICSLKSPSATTTIISPRALFVPSVTYANNFEVGLASNAFATTTSLGKITIAANGSGELVGTTTVTALKDGVVPPNSYINFRVSTSTASATFAQKGTCVVEFRGF